jgi:hypothetical protein
MMGVAHERVVMVRQCGVAGLNVNHPSGHGIDFVLYGAGARLLGECMIWL